MRIEERLFEALQDEADRIDVDVAALHRATRDRLGGRGAAAPDGGPAAGSPRSSRRPRWPPSSPAAWRCSTSTGCPAAVTSRPSSPTAAVSTRASPARPSARSASTGRPPTTRSCPGSTTTSAPPRTRPSRRATRSPSATASPCCSLGNADGTLASRTTFRRGADGCERVEAVVCTGTSGNLVPTAGADRLGVHPGGLVDEPGSTPRRTSRTAPCWSTRGRRTTPWGWRTPGPCGRCPAAAGSA